MGATYRTYPPPQEATTNLWIPAQHQEPWQQVVHNLAAGGPRGQAAGYGPGMAGTRPSAGGRQELGRLGEALAATLLEAAGLRVVARNWRCREGEIDLIAAGPGLLVFCEVKTRRGHGYGSPAAAVTPMKQARLRRLAAAYLAAVPTPSCRVRFDVVAVTCTRGYRPLVEHLEGVF
jgi:putative endonuclease